MKLTWVRRKGSDWHWYNVKGCGAGWSLNDWSGETEMCETDEASRPTGAACVECMSRLASYRTEPR